MSFEIVITLCREIKDVLSDIRGALREIREAAVLARLKAEQGVGQAEAHYANVEDIILDPAAKRLVKSRWTTLVFAAWTLVVFVLGAKLGGWLF